MSEENVTITNNDFITFLKTSYKHGDPSEWMNDAGIEEEVLSGYGGAARRSFIEAVTGKSLEEIIPDMEEGESFGYAAISIKASNFGEIMERLETFSFNLACSAFQTGWEAHKHFKGEREDG